MNNRGHYAREFTECPAAQIVNNNKKKINKKYAKSVTRVDSDLSSVWLEEQKCMQLSATWLSDQRNKSACDSQLDCEGQSGLYEFVGCVTTKELSLLDMIQYQLLCRTWRSDHNLWTSWDGDEPYLMNPLRIHDRWSS